MAKRTKTTTFKFQEMIVQCIERESDESEDEISDEESEMSSSDSDAEAMFLEGGDITPNNADLSEGGRWNNVDDPDITPPQPTFRPTHPPGPQLIHTTTHAALQLFQLFFTNSILQTIVQNTNDYGSRHSTPSNPWTDLTLRDMFSFMSLVIYMGVVKCSAFSDYWRRGKLYGLPFPRQVMSGKKFLRICHALRLSSPAVDAANKQKRGTAAFDPLCKIKPLYQELREACIRNYHPSQEITIHEHIVATESRVGLKQCMENKPVHLGYKLFALVDTRSGYTWDFVVYKGKENSIKGLGYDSVMELIDMQLLGTGYKLFVDHFHTSPSLFHNLLQKRIWACGPIRVGFPKTKNNSLDSKSPRGSMRWIRNDSLLFVQWRDTKDVFMCSTIHAAHEEDTLQRRVKGADENWPLKDVSAPPAVKEYNQCMSGLDLSDALIGSFKAPHKTQKWHKTFFYHFMDIAVVNAFLLHKDVAKRRGEILIHQKVFRETLAEELAAVGSPSTARTTEPPPPPPAAPRRAHHRPVHISGHSTAGRQKCRQCRAKTPVKCSSCDVPLCFIPGRDCYNMWHVTKKQ